MENTIEKETREREREREREKEEERKEGRLFYVHACLLVGAGFPFTKEEEMAVEVDKLMKSTVVSGHESPLGDRDQLLLMTHNGPSHSCE